MKKILAFLIASVMFIGILLPNFSLFVSAEGEATEESSAKENENDIRDDRSVSFSCSFDSSNYSIDLGGTVNHSALIKYHDYTVEIYAIPIGENAEETVFSPDAAAIAKTPIAVRFQLSKKIENIIEKYYSYCVVLCSPDGKRILATDPRYASVASDVELDETLRAGYKGIETELIPSAANTGAGRIVIPIYLNKLISEVSSGYVYQANSENVYFERSYIEALDAKVRTVSASGAQTYFRVLVDGVGGIAIKYLQSSKGARVYMPDVYDEKTLARVEAGISFLTERYKDMQSGIVNGIIVGSRVDDINIDYIEAQNGREYTDEYALYTLLVANSARNIRSDIDIVIPFSDDNIFDGNTADSMLETLVRKFDLSFSSGFCFSVMIEGSVPPIKLEDGKLSFVENNEKLYAQNIKAFDEYLEGLGKSYKSAPVSFSFAWLVPNGLAANELCVAYAYSYLKLAECKIIASFTLSFSDMDINGESDGFNALKNIFEYIDTSERENVLSNVLKAFEKETWKDVLDGKEPKAFVIRKNLTVPVKNTVPKDVKGEFVYFDFSTSVSLNNWYKGINCETLRLDYGSEGAALSAEMKASALGEYSELLCLYDYPENFKYTPYLAFKCKIDNAAAKDSMFEIMISGGQVMERLCASQTVLAGDETVIVLDLSEYENELTDSWKISVRSLDGRAENFSLNIYDVIGYSTEYDSETLATKIEEERLRIRNLSKETEDEGKNSVLAVIITIAILIISLGIGILVCIRQSDNESDKDKTEETTAKK